MAELSDRPIVQAVVRIVVGIAASFLFLYIVPVVAVYLLYCGRGWYLSPDPRRKKAGLLLLLAGTAGLMVSYVVFAGLVRSPRFSSGTELAVTVGTLV